MNTDILFDEQELVKRKLSASLSSFKEKKKVYYLSNVDYLNTYYMVALNSLCKESVISDCFCLNSSDSDECIKKITVDEYEKIENEKNCVFILNIDFTGNILTDDIATCVEKTIKLSSSSADNKCIITAIMPPVPDVFSREIKLAEKEYDCVTKSQEMFAAYFRFKSITDNCVESGNKNFSVIRTDNVFGIAVEDNSVCIFNEIACNSFKDDCISATTADRLHKFSFTYIRDIPYAVAYALAYAKKGETYNLSTFISDWFEIKKTAADCFKDKLGFSFDCAPAKHISYRCIDNLKLSKVGGKKEWAPSIDMQESVHRMFCYVSGKNLRGNENFEIYSGKLKEIKKIEVDELDEIDRICKENGISYFLAGGTLLGAIRHKGFVPWDDDIDVGMLREDFEKFRKVCPSQLCEKYVFSSSFYDENCPYNFDKIRLKDTYFSTQFSSKFNMEDGVFADILAYDCTAQTLKGQNRHLKYLKKCMSVAKVRSVGKNAKANSRFFKLLYPIISKIPKKTFIKIVNKALTKYTNKNTEYVIDGMGMHIQNGAFKKEWISQTMQAEFENKMYNIPVGYDEYLKFLYGDDYMDIPVISKRTVKHQPFRIDLSEYISDCSKSDSQPVLADI